jgi:hypothetical protein
MKRWELYLLIAVAVGLFFTVRGPQIAFATQLPGLERPCIYAAGAAQEVTSLAATSDSSTVLEVPGAYMITCDEEAYVRFGATAPTAVSGDFIFRKDVTYFFGTGGDAGIAYVAARNVTTNGSCWLLECR